MCGIAGVLGPAAAEADAALDLLGQMGAALVHRGPDDHGEWCDAAAAVALGHRRLSINDLSPAGRQPMHSASGRYVLALNGEIYNFLELRAEFEDRGYAFRGHSDTEVALAAFERHGLVGALQRFVGMFALALWDREERRLYLARDRVGEKPLYFGRVGDSFAFASELAALRCLPGWSGGIDRDALGLLMQHFYVPAPRTIHPGIFKLRPGHWLGLRAGETVSPDASTAYWSAAALASAARETLAPEDAVEALDGLLRRTIRDKMIADVPLGAFLSGGIDSSTVVAMMQAESTSPVRTFSIGFNERSYNEAEEAKRVAAHLGTDHTELYVSPEEALAVIPKLPGLYSEPFADSSQIPTYLVSAMAREHVTVALSGDGGDELFGGYVRYFLAEQLWQRLARLPRPLRAALGNAAGALPPQQVDRVMRALKPLVPARWRYRQFGNKVHKFANICRTDDPMAVYRSLISMWQRPSQVVVGAGDVDLIAELPAAVASAASFTERMMLTDLLSYLPGDILTKVDRASMGVSLEVRVPFLDHRVIEHAWRVPLEYKVRDGGGKWLLKQVLGRYVPRELVERPKMGFGVPIDAWLRGPLREWGAALLDPAALEADGLFHADVVATFWQEHVAGRADWASLLWPILMFQAWLEHHERAP